MHTHHRCDDPTSKGQTISFHHREQIPRTSNNGFNKTVARYNQLRSDPRISPEVEETDTHEYHNENPQCYYHLQSEPVSLYHLVLISNNSHELYNR